MTTKNERAPLLVFPPGTRIKIADGQIEGVVTQACISAGPRIQHQVAWWSGREHKLEWLESFEVSGDYVNDAVAVGFAGADRGGV